MTYYTWNGINDDEPTEHHFGYGTINLWKEGLIIGHWADKFTPDLKPEVLADIEAWGGRWEGPALEVIFPTEKGALMWKMKYHSPHGCTSPDTTKYYTREEIEALKETEAK
jgi:hypothetical protein